MTLEPMRRRQALQRLCLGVAAVLGGCGSIADSDGATPTDTGVAVPTDARNQTATKRATPTGTGTAGGESPPCVTPDHEDVTDHGAAGDGQTDDTQAIREAANSAGPGGTVYFPAGTYLIGADSYNPLNYPGDGSWDGITWKGESYDTTTIKMAGGHDSVYYTGWRFGDGTVTDGTWTQLTLDGNKGGNSHDNSACLLGDGNDAGEIRLTDCVVRDWRGGAIALSGTADLWVADCLFRDQGKATGAGGSHDINVNMRDATVEVARTHFKGTAGESIDVGDDSSNDYMTVQADLCLFEGMRSGFKLDPENDTTTINNCRFTGGGYTTVSGVKANNSDYNCGSVEMNDCLVEGGTWPGVFVAADDFDDLRLDNVVVSDVDNGDNVGAGVYAKNASLDVGDLSIRDVGSADTTDAVRFEDCSGTVRRLTYAGTSPPFFEFESVSSNPQNGTHSHGDRPPHSHPLNWAVSDVSLEDIARSVALSPDVVPADVTGPVSYCPAEE